MDFRFVRTDFNPAEPASRGVLEGAAKFMEEFRLLGLWTELLGEPEAQWPEP